MISVRTGAVLLALLGALVVAAPSASAERGAAFSLGVSKDPGGPFDSNSGLKVKKGKKKFLYFEVANNIASTQTLTLTDGFTTTPNPPEGYQIRWYRELSGKKQITSDVTGAGFSFEIEPEGIRYFKAQVKRTGNNPGFCLNARVSSGPSSEQNTYSAINGEPCIL